MERMFGEMNGHAVGIIMKELVRRAIKAIRHDRVAFQVQEKQTPGKDYDIVTSADRAAQKIYLRGLQECFPDFGIVAEEENFRKPCNLKGEDVYFSVDPLDGTKAFSRRQSHGAGTQIALRCGYDIVSAWVGDVMTQEIYGFRPGSQSVWRISEYDTAERLAINPERPLAEQYLLLCDSSHKFPEAVSRMISAPFTANTRFFRDYEIEGGSIGLRFARLWKGEVGGLVLSAQAETPWDAWPINGISHKMGFAFYAIGTGRQPLSQYIPCPSNEVEHRMNPRLVIHKSRVGEVEAFMANQFFG